MRWFIFILLSISLLFYSEKSEAQFVSITSKNKNVLYSEIYNHLNLSVSNYKISKIFVKTNLGVISGENGDFDWYINQPINDSVTFFVYAIINKKNILLDSVVFHVEPIKDPILKVAGHYNYDTITTSLLKAQIGIVAVWDNLNIECVTTVEEFDVYLNDAFIEHGTSPLFSDELKTIIQNKKIDSITFKKVKVKTCTEKFLYPNDYKLFLRI